jgi:uncharacterized membrane protein affecting hemolysin expression
MISKKQIAWTLGLTTVAGVVIGYILRKTFKGRQRRAEGLVVKEAVQSFENEGGLVAPLIDERWRR